MLGIRTDTVHIDFHVTSIYTPYVRFRTDTVHTSTFMLPGNDQKRVLCRAMLSGNVTGNLMFRGRHRSMFRDVTC